MLTTRVEGEGATIAPLALTLPESTSERDLSDVHRGTIALATGLLPAMAAGRALRVELPVSARLLDGLEQFQRIQAAWFPDAVAAVPLIAEGQPLPAHPAPRTAAFFTGGVDSFFTMLRHRESIDAGIYVDGFDVPLEQGAMLARVHGELDQIARRLDRPMLTLRSTARAAGTTEVDWGYLGHGHALAATGLVLGALGWSTVLIPSTASYNTLNPWGSHPLLDPLWSTEATEVVHDGAGSERSGKVAAIGRDEIVRDHLRVCWERFDALNCSRCEKCLRTMSLLLATGDLPHVRTFRRPRSLVPLARRPLHAEEHRTYAIMAARALQRTGRHRRLARAFEAAAETYRVERAGGRPSLVQLLERLPPPRLPQELDRSAVPAVRPSTIVSGGAAGAKVTVTIGMTALGIPESVSAALPGAIDPTDTTLPGDLALLLGLLPAMLLGAPLQVEQPVSARLLAHVATAQDVLASWYPTWVDRVAVHADAGPPSPAGRGAVLLVDESNAAIASALARRGKVAALSPLATADAAIASAAGHHLESPAAVAEALGAAIGAPVVRLDPLAVALLGGVLDRDRLLRGIEVGVQARLLGALGYGELLVAAPHHARALRPAGSHPIVDPLWSTERLTVRHVDLDRPELERDTIAARMVEGVRRGSPSR
ncbi:hypothetical protein [Microcella humidisoli]|uniref:Uncharacterized protein n=1 Tax=Microcella humidisoli TaxID=2963406 RepID=A0ABY5FXG5_9MICO|nr:hypothetical protein [Microcella humidisoli]UTT62993.1 hypothetical protein NNL39_02480 [Microcella humidisoli]